MGLLRGLMWFVGVCLLVGGAGLVYFPLGVAGWIAYTVAGCGLVLLLGLMVTIGARRPAPQRVTRRLVMQLPPNPGPFNRWANPVPDSGLTKPTASGDADYTGMMHSQRTEPDGTVVEGMVRTERVVRNTRTGRRTYARKTKTITRRRPLRKVLGAKSRTHGTASTMAPTRRSR